MAIKNVYDAVNTIHHNLLNGFHLGFYHWLHKNKQNLVSNIKKLEQAVSLIKDQRIIDDQNKLYIIKIISSFLRELELFYSMHTNEMQLAQLAKILDINFSEEPDLKQVDQKLMDIANWVMDNSVGAKMVRIVKTIDPELEFSGFAGMGEFGVVLVVKKNNLEYALKIAKKNNETLQLVHPVLGNFKRTLKNEFAIMTKLWNHRFQAMPRPIEFYHDAPCFDGEERGNNAFLMSYLKNLSTPSVRSLDDSEYFKVQKMVDQINSLGYVIPLDFKGNLKKTNNGLKIIDFIGFSKMKKGKEQEIKLFQRQILKELENWFKHY